MTPEEANQRLAEAQCRLGRPALSRVFVRDAAVPLAVEEGSGAAAASSSAAAAPGEGEASGASAPGASSASSGPEGEGFYDFTAADYARIMASRKEEIFLKPRKFREKELEEKRSRIRKAVIRVQFPDGVIVECNFKPTDTVADVRQVITQCLADPSLPFHFFTAPPRRKIADEALDLYTAELAPGALIYFAQEGLAQPQPLTGGADRSATEPTCVLAPFILDLKGVDFSSAEEGLASAAQEQEQPQVAEAARAPPPAAKPAEKKPGVPKWFKKTH